MKQLLPLSAFLLATACATVQPEAPLASAPAAPVQAAPVDSAAEDQRLTAFLDAAFEAQAARSPEFLTALGRKEQYDRLDTYTDEYRQQSLALAQSQLQQLRASTSSLNRRGDAAKRVPCAAGPSKPESRWPRSTTRVTPSTSAAACSSCSRTVPSA